MTAACSRRICLRPWFCLLGTLLITTACVEKPTSEVRAHSYVDDLAPWDLPETTKWSAPLPKPKPERTVVVKRPTKPQTIVAALPRAPEVSEGENLAALPREPDVPEETKPNALSPDKVVGMTQDEIKQHLGVPSFEEEAAPAKIWLYTAGKCSFKVYFFPEVESLVYRALRYETIGGPETDDRRCLSEIR